MGSKNKVSHPHSLKAPTISHSSRLMERVGDILTANVFSVYPETSVREASSLMSRENISCLPVFKKRKMIGIITERDIVRYFSKNSFSDSFSCEDLMSAPVTVVQEDTLLPEAYQVLSENNIRHLPVEDCNGTLKGIITQTDIVRNLVPNLFGELKNGMTDQEKDGNAESFNCLEDLIFASTSEALAITDLDFRITYCNSIAEKMHGIKISDIHGKNIQDMYLKKDEKERLHEAITSMRSMVECRYVFCRTVGEEVRFIEAKLSGIYHAKGNLLGYALLSKDITDRVTAENALKETEERFRIILEEMPFALIQCSLDNEPYPILEVNKTGCEMYGYSLQELTQEGIEILTGKNRGLFAERYAKELLYNQTVMFEERHVSKAGLEFPVAVTVRKVTLQKRKVALFLVRDNSERKDAELALGQISSQLVQLQEQERKRIAAELHDGLGQNLVMIRNEVMRCLNLLKEGGKPVEELDQIGSLVLQTLEEVREISYNLRPHLLDQLGLKTAISSILERISNSSSIDISYSIDPIDGLFSKEKEINIYRIVQEGLTNITKHSCASEAIINILKKEKEVLIEMKDNGKGFAWHTKRPERNAGFGLKCINERVKILGGSLKIVSDLGAGSCLFIQLPIQEQSHRK